MSLWWLVGYVTIYSRTSRRHRHFGHLTLGIFFALHAAIEMAGFPRHMYTFLLDETEPGFRLTEEQTAAVLGFRLRRDIEVPNHEMMYGWRCAAHFRTGKGDWGVTMRKGVTICTPATRKARVRKVLCEEDSTSCDKSFVVSEMLDIGMRTCTSITSINKEEGISISKSKICNAREMERRLGRWKSKH